MDSNFNSSQVAVLRGSDVWRRQNCESNFSGLGGRSELFGVAGAIFFI